jgi:tetratricopeptide (TPR) repeat protein
MFFILILTTSSIATPHLLQDPTGRPEGAAPKRKKPGREKPKPAIEPITVILTVLTDPAGSDVYVNGQMRGTTDAEGKIQFSKLPLGGYGIEVRKDGYTSAHRSFSAGFESPTLVFKLTPALDDTLKEFNSLLASGKIVGPEMPNALDIYKKAAAKYADRPELGRMRGAVADKLKGMIAAAAPRTLTNWREITREELTRARSMATTLSGLAPEERQAKAYVSYFNGVVALRDWQVGPSQIAANAGAGAKPENGSWPDEATGGLPRARAELEKAVELDETWALAWYKLGHVLMFSNEYGAAEAAFVKTAQLEPRWSVAHSGLGAAYYAGRKYKEAIAVYQKATELDSRSVEAYAGLGLARAANRDVNGGLKDVQRAMDLDRSSALPHFHIGIIYSLSKKDKDLVKAEDEIKKAIQMNPQNFEFQNRIAEQVLIDVQSRIKKKK